MSTDEQESLLASVEIGPELNGTGIFTVEAEYLNGILSVWLENASISYPKTLLHSIDVSAYAPSSGYATIAGTTGAKHDNQLIHFWYLETAPLPKADISMCLQATSNHGAAVILNANCFDDEIDNSLTYDWYENYGESDEAWLGEGTQLGVMLKEGVHPITLIVTNENSDTDIDEFLIKVLGNNTPNLGAKIRK